MLKIDLSVERDKTGQVIQVFFDRERGGEAISYEELIRTKHYQLIGGTIFQRAVWQELQNIVPGHPITYQEMARRVGSPGAARGVGQALARNPLPIIFPCHRVIKSDGSLGGFMGGENALEIKKKLLDYERGQVQNSLD